MSNQAHDLLLLLLNLTQQRSPERICDIFIEAAGALVAPAELWWLGPDESFDGEVIAVETLNKSHGRIAVERADAIDLRETLPLLRNAASILATILEKLENDRELAGRQLLLESEVESRTAELANANRKLRAEIEERKRSERALRESEEKFEALFHSSPDLVGLIDLEGVILDINRVAPGYEKEKVIGTNVTDFLTPEQSAEFRTAVERAVATGEPESYSPAIAAPDGRTTHWHNRVSPLKSDGETTQLVINFTDITPLRETERALLESRARLVEAQRLAGMGDFIWDVATGSVTWSDAMFDLIGYERTEQVDLDRVNREIHHPDDVERVTQWLQACLEPGGEAPNSAEYRLIRGDGEIIEVRTTVRVTTDENGRITIVGAVQNITAGRNAERERAHLEGQLHQAQKMEAVGRLAGGVAHDFNNILTGITGFTELIQSSLGPGDPLWADLEEIRLSAERAAELTSQLLAFSRKQVIQPVVIQPNDVLQGSQMMLRRIIGEDVDFHFKPSRGLWRIKADPGQLDQILVNLAVNARDAMPDGGTMTIETRNATVDEDDASSVAGIEPGDFVVLEVSDDGRGMDAETQQHIFEPFYSTKGRGQGTGLGLATVYGIVKQNQGFIDVSSEPGKGSTFGIYFPAVPGEADAFVPKPRKALPTGTETVLLVEDEDMVRQLAKRILERQGYTVLEMANGGFASDWAEKNDDVVDVLLTDVVMPGMNGKELYERLTEKRPGLKVLFMSGYTEDVIATRGVLDEGTAFIQKPFNVASLTRKIRQTLDG